MSFFKLIININARFYSTAFNKGDKLIMKYLNVAEKNDAAKNISGFLSRGTARRREGLSKYNKIYEFDANLFSQNVQMTMTSVSGHLLNFEFASNFRSWNSCNPVVLFDAPILKACSKDYEPIKKTLEREIRSCQGLIIWTDCDREGENIGFEIIKVCKDIKPNLNIYRAKFSEITTASVFRALNNLIDPNQNVSNAVDVRQEMDLRTGAAFTRLQTLHLCKVFPGKLSQKLISYGSCQFPTLGFVVDRYKDMDSFIPEAFWKIKMSHTIEKLTVDYNWDRDRLFVKNPVESMLDICKETPTARVDQVISKPKNKWRPVPLDTVEMEKTISKKLHINAKETMKIAERLYTQGFISYPRTETNIFPKELNLRPLVEQQTVDQRWGEFANRILNDGGPTPRQGKKTDQAHPPIHPTKHAPNLSGNEQKVYEYIVRHFLACCSKDAVGHETIIKVNIAEEKFTTKGLIILERNYLDVFIYEKWNAKEVHNYREGDTFDPTLLELAEGATTAPTPLTEAELIGLMEKNGIGTDATHADHIDTIKNREYVGLHENKYFVPGTLGMGLVEGYDAIGLEISLAKPLLRSQFENDLKLICEGKKDPKVVLRDQIVKYRTMFENVVSRMNQLEEKLANRIEEQRVAVQNSIEGSTESFKPILKCPKCDTDIVIKKKKDGSGIFLSCCGFPACRNAIWLPGFVETAEVTDETCGNCGPNVKKLKVKFRTGQNPFFGENPKVLCVGGCDMNVMEHLNIALSSVIKTNDPVIHVNTPPPRPATNNTNNSNNTWTRPNSIPRTNNNSRQNTTNNNNQSNNSTRRNNSDSGYSSSQNRSTTLPFPRGGNTTVNRGSGPPATVDPLCNCGNSALLLTVRKDGPNKGRQFYKCQNGKDGGGCDYFLWAPSDQSAPDHQNPRPPDNNSYMSSSPASAASCNCGQPSVLRTVQKEGPNKGRQFYCCSGPMQSKCNYFQWATDGNDGGGDGGWNSFGGGGNGGWNSSFGGGGNARGGYSRGRGGNRGRGGTKRKTSNSSGGNPGAKRRKCGLCQTEGHNRNNCPNRDT